MIRIRPAAERGHADHGWLDTWHTFSFAHYHDPRHMGFRSLRVVNDDRVAPGKGFDTHGHRDMEILTYVLAGSLTHKDSLGNGSIIRPGEIQRMTAGTGVQHSERNPSPDEWLHLLQIWILPERGAIEPGYEQIELDPAGARNRLQLIASREGGDGAVLIHQDARLFRSLLDKGAAVAVELASARHAFVHVARGSALIDGKNLGPGDGAAVSDAARFELTGAGDGVAEVLVFDLA